MQITQNGDGSNNPVYVMPFNFTLHLKCKKNVALMKAATHGITTKVMTVSRCPQGYWLRLERVLIVFLCKPAQTNV